ncbi:serine hydrolase [Phenylobacterium sp.]|uniref:serine hydrolase n=1 Tax=Phenylobacterium sp. TaxID=1871053 RepID=UPI0011FBF4AB|nr:serine hydrolase [Phenylobacterium sp.]THD62636.1 MAG: serine hydrolase [Phenylobacterium sp.]
MRRLLTALSAGLLVLNATAPARAQTPPSPPAVVPWATPSDAEIHDILVQRIDVEHSGVGVVVGVIDARGRRFVSYGVSDKRDPKPVGPRTVFEIGSMTKVFTSLVLSEMVQDGEVKLDDPVAKYLPPGTKIPERNGKQITLVDIATQSSGLPRMPSNFTPKDWDNPYADYGEAQLFQFLAGYSLPRDIGSKYEYSNLAVGLMGDALARRAGVDYETLVKRRIIEPLRMTSTTITLSPALKARLAQGHDSALDPVANWDFGILPGQGALAGAGALRSDAEDILTFLGAELGYVKTPLAAAMKAEWTSVRRPAAPGLSVALGWHISSPPGRDEIVWHNGGTGGYRTYMGFDPKTGVGVVVLTNAATGRGGDDIGAHILNGAPLQPPPPDPAAGRHAVALDPKALDLYVGRYQLAPQVFLTVTHDGDRFVTQITGQPHAAIFPESRTDFFYRIVDAQLRFDLPASGPASGVTLHQAGRDLVAKRVVEP